MIALALGVLLASAARAKPAERVFAVGNKVAAVYSHEAQFFILPPDAMVTVGGRSAFGPLAENGMLLVLPELQPVKTVRFGEKIERPAAPERNASRFLICTDPEEIVEYIEKSASLARFCGVFDVAGKAVYEAPSAPGESIQALALSSDGNQALFEYRRGKDVESYLVWTEKAKQPKTYKADMRDLELRRALNRFGLNDWNPEPEKNPKPGAHNP